MNTTSPDHRALYEIAEEQAGYFTAKQGHEAGFSSALLTYHTTTGRFRRILRGLYRLSQYPSSAHEDLVVAWLRAGPGAVVSHESALAILDLSDALPSTVHLTVSRTASRRKPGIRLHTTGLSADEVTRRDGLPITTAARTIADAIVTGLGEELVEQAIEDALARGLATPRALRDQADRRAGRVRQVIEQALRHRG